MDRLRTTVLVSLAAGTLLGTALAHAGEELRDVLGVTHCNGKYFLTSGDYLNEGADQVLASGSRVIKLYLSPAKYPWNSNWRSDYASLKEIADSPYFRNVFAKPFHTYVLTCYSIGRKDHYWTTRITEQDKADETRQFYELAKHLLTTYRGTGKVFVLQHWEGDWALRDVDGHTFDPRFTPTPTAIDGMIQWLNARQAGINQARAEIADSDVHVYGAAEANRVADSMAGKPGVANSVLPHTTVDLISYSSWDTQHDAKQLAAAVDFLASNLPATAAFGRSARSVYIGEFGYPENGRQGAAGVDEVIDNVLRVVREKQIPWALYWEIYCNELAHHAQDLPPGAAPTPVNGMNNAVKGFWMIKPDGTHGQAWVRYRQLLSDVKASTNE
jgi:hypothetical protein